MKLFNAKIAGTVALQSKNGGYCRGTLLKRPMTAHRAAWAIHYGRWPAQTIDHINGDRSDNRLVNLRELSRADNARNKGSPKSAKSKFVGVSWFKRSGKWRARSPNAHGRVSLGLFETEIEAAKAYDKFLLSAGDYLARPNFRSPTCPE